MLKSIQIKLIILTITAICTACSTDVREESLWKKDFNISERNLEPTGRNPYFILEPGFQLVLEGSTGFLGATDVKLIITVLDETKEVDGTITRVVEEREWKNNELYEVARNFFAIDPETRDVFYFGEEVDFYSDGKIVDHKGAWLVGEKDAQAGLIMPGEPQVGMMYYQEIAPEVAMDRAEIIDLNYELETPAGPFSDCLRTKEGTALNLSETEYKTYAAGIGLIQDEKLLLIKYGFTGEK
jgi:hypothetical protein